MNNTMTTGQTTKLAQKFIARGNDFECSLGVAMMKGNYKQRCKLMNAFPRKVEKFNL